MFAQAQLQSASAHLDQHCCPAIFINVCDNLAICHLVNRNPWVGKSRSIDFIPSKRWRRTMSLTKRHLDVHPKSARRLPTLLTL